MNNNNTNIKSSFFILLAFIAIVVCSLQSDESFVPVSIEQTQSADTNTQTNNDVQNIQKSWKTYKVG